ncbi:unnamed protein product [Schistosoma curassoni]|uniref:Uncharacterized protein n=1 Tax=Schistosoma curassoni TaxID=6186 RepID=A0A183JGF2_9TREM|nr:unnamed protein product [Schistosoma curassoni]
MEFMNNSCLLLLILFTFLFYTKSKYFFLKFDFI